MTQTSTPLGPGRDDGPAPDSLIRGLIGRISRFEIVVGAVIALKRYAAREVFKHLPHAV